jgi:ankyrin repeat protein
MTHTQRFRTLKTAKAAWLLLVLVARPAAAAPHDLALVEAVKGRDAAAVRALLQKHADVNAPEADGTTALHWAVRQDDGELAALLIENGANANARNRYGVTPLELAATNGSSAMVARLLDAGADPNAAMDNGQTVLMTAARAGNAAAVRKLLAAGAAADTTEKRRGTTALMWAAEDNRADVVRFLIEAGARVTARSHGDYSPLLIAARAGSLDAARVLVAAGADVNDSAPPGDPRESISLGVGRPTGVVAYGPEATGAVRTSALVLAMLNGHFDFATWLLDQGADPNAADPRGTPLHVLAWIRKPGLPLDGGPVVVTFGQPDSSELARALLRHGANPNARIAWKEIPFDRIGGQVRLPPTIRMGRWWTSFIGATPFWLAAQHNDVPLMRLLLDNGADPHIATVQNVTPLMAAAGMGSWDYESPSVANGTTESESLEAVKICLETGANVNETTKFSEIHPKGDAGTLRYRYLLPNEVPTDGTAYGDMRWGNATALHAAALRGINIVVQHLVEQGARLDAKTSLGWTPLMIADSVFAANLERIHPETADLIRRLMQERGIAIDDSSKRDGNASRQSVN